MPYTVATVRASVEAELDNTEFSDAKITQFMNDVNRRIINSRQWSFMESSGNLSYTVGDATNALPSGAQTIISLRQTAPTDADLTNKFIDYRTAGSKFASNMANGAPAYWTYTGGQLTLYPTPDGSYTLNVRYLRKPTTLDDDADVPDVPEEFQEILVIGTVMKCLRHDDRYNEALALKQEYDELMTDMLLRYSPRQLGTTHIMRSNRGRVNKSIFNA